MKKPAVDLRVGVSTPRLIGMVTKPDPSAVPDNAFGEILNGRLVGGRLVCRGGQSKVNSGGITSGCPELIFDAGDLGAREADALPPKEGVWGIGFTDGTADDLGESAFHFNALMTPDAQEFVAAVEGAAVGDVMGIAYVSAHDALYVTCEGDTSVVDIPSTVRKIRLPSHAADPFATLSVINSLSGPVQQAACIDYGSNLFVADGRVNGAAAGVAAVYKITSTGVVTLEDTPSQLVVGPVMGVFGTDLYVAYNSNASDSGNALIKKRTSLGVWSSLGSPGVAGLVVYGMVEYGSKLWIIGIAGSNVYLISWNGASFTTERTITPAGGIAVQFCCIGVFNSLLYFTYVATTGVTGNLGKYDGATWTNSEYSSGLKAFVGMSAWNGNLYLHTTQALLVSTGTTTTAFSTAFTPMTTTTRPHNTAVIS